MNLRMLRLALPFLFLATPLAGPPARAQEATNTKALVTALASERLGGRAAGSEGERFASELIVTELSRFGAKPLPGRTDYRLPFAFTAGTRDGGSSITVTRGPDASRTGDAPSVAGAGATSAWTSGTREEIQALSFSDSGKVTGPVVFAGYGLVVPDSQDFGYDSYAGLDVKDKIVMVLRYFPEDADQKTKGVLSRYAGLRYKAMAARQRGARALLVVTGPRSPNAGKTVPMTFDAALAGSGIVAASIGGAAAAAIFATVPDKSLETAQQALDSGNPHVAGFDIPNATVTLSTSVVREQRTGFNVLAYLPATGDPSKLDKSWVALGAHYDHLGRGDYGSSLASEADAGRVHLGADDNASGTAAVLAVGRLLAAQPRHRNVLLGFWSGEELGLIGSSAFITRPQIPIEEFAAYLNLDMVGRMQDNKLTIQAVGSSPAWPRMLEQANIAAGFDLRVQNDPYLPTDSASFNQAGVPTLNFFTGTHADYHKPSDTPDKIDYDDLDRVVEFAATVARRVAELEEAPMFTKVEQQIDGGPSREGLRVFTGTIPDYSTEAKGLLLSGVMGGGPAELAGLQKGDVIVEIAGQTIANIYDYTYALDVLKIGEPTKVVYVRNGERRETMLTPTARR